MAFWAKVAIGNSFQSFLGGYHCSFYVKLLLLTKNSRSGISKGALVQVQSAGTYCSTVNNHLGVGSAQWSGSKLVEFKEDKVVRITLRLSSNMAWYSPGDCKRCYRSGSEWLCHLQLITSGCWHVGQVILG